MVVEIAGREARVIDALEFWLAVGSRPGLRGVGGRPWGGGGAQKFRDRRASAQAKISSGKARRGARNSSG